MTGSFSGDLFSPFDSSDYYKIYAAGGQQIKVGLGVPSGFNHDLSLLDPSGVSVRTSTNGVGVAESIDFVATSTGYWYIAIAWISGTGSGTYACSVDISAGQDIFYLDVGSAGDMTATDHLPGFSLLSGWYSTVDSMREGAVNAAFLLNLYEKSYQSNVGYMITVRYLATASTSVQVLSNGVWVDVAIMPGDSSSSTRTYSFILDPDYLSDSLPGTLGMNVQLRFAHALTVDCIDARSATYTTDFSAPDTYHNPGIALESGWSLVDGIANENGGATLLVSVPDVKVFYLIAFECNSDAVISLEQWTASGYISLGSAPVTGGSATFLINKDYYYDVDGSKAGMNLRLRLSSSLNGLSSITISPAKAYTDNGAGGDTDIVSHMFGATINPWSDWSGQQTVSGRSVRQTTSANTNFLLNGAISGEAYEITLCYFATNNGEILMRTISGNDISCASIVGNSQWNTVSFWVAAAEYYDYLQMCEINVMFRITAVGTYVDYFYASIDSDGDTLSDAYETNRVGSIYSLDPFNADTDSDNLKDAAELTAGTNPTNPDTDNDGLLDGGEQWSQTWSSEQFYRVPNGAGNNGRPCIPITIPSIPIERITSIKVHIGVITDRAQDIEIWVNKVGIGPHLNLYYRANSGANVFESFVPIDGTYTMAQYASGGTFNFYVADWNSEGGDGQVQYVRLEVSGKTNPLVADTDGDSILDGEEVNMGADGWITNPVFIDTDSDYVTDYNEIHGNTVCGQPLDPTYADTDGDGYGDSADKYLGDMMLHVRFYFFNAWEDINNGNTHNIFFTLAYDGVTLSTARLNNVQTHVNQNFALDYYIDASEVGTSKSFVMTAVADDAGGLNDDIKLDCESTNAGATDYPFTFNFADGIKYVDAHGEDDGWINQNSDCEVMMFIETVVRSKANTIVINSTEDSSGLYVASDGSYRYNADEQVYMIYITTPGASAHFAAGVNAIIVPRYLALESQLNETLVTNPGTSELSGASFYATDAAQASSSGHIVAVIEKSMSNSDAEALLGRLTHAPGPGNEQIGNSVVISQNNIYLLHLPKDIQSRIPYVGMSSSPLGAPTNYLDNIAVLEFLYNCLVSLGTGLYNLASSLVQAGINYVNNLWNAVTAAVTVIVNAFNAFVQWAIEFIQSVIAAIISPLTNAVNDAWTGYCTRIASSVQGIDADIRSTGQPSPATLQGLCDAIKGDLYWLLFGVLAAVSVVLLAIKVVTSVVGFLLGMAIGLVTSYIMVAAFNAIKDDAWGGSLPTAATSSAYQTWSVDMSAKAKNPSNASKPLDGWVVVGGGYLVWETLLGIIDYKFMAENGLPKIAAVSNLVVGILGFAMSVYADTFNVPQLNDIAIFMEVASFLSSFIILGLDHNRDEQTYAWFGATAIFSIIGLGLSVGPYFLE